MPRIAISYRRSDSAASAGRIADRLASRYGKDSVFIDVDSVPVGTNFREYIQQAWSRMDVLIVVVGRQWLGETEDAVRIHERMDPVRLEVETAMRIELPIIPVLVDDARMPTTDDLPRSLRAFADCNAANIDGGRDFHAHMDRVIQAIDHIAGEGPSRAGPTNESLARCDADRLPPPHPLARTLLDIAIAVCVLVVVHHLIVNVFDLATIYLRIASFLVPFVLGAIFFRYAPREPIAALAVAAGVGMAAVVAMAVSAGLSSGQPIMPSTSYEWRESVEYLVSIWLSFFAGDMAVRYAGLSFRRTGR